MPAIAPLFVRGELRDYSAYAKICADANVNEAETFFWIGFKSCSSTQAMWRRGNRKSPPGVPVDALHKLREVLIERGDLPPNYPEVKPWHALSLEERADAKPDASRHPSQKIKKAQYWKPAPVYQQQATPIKRVHPKIEPEAQATHTALANKQVLLLKRENATLMANQATFMATQATLRATIATLEKRLRARITPNVEVLVAVGVDEEVFEFELVPTKKHS